MSAPGHVPQDNPMTNMLLPCDMTLLDELHTLKCSPTYAHFAALGGSCGCDVSFYKGNALMISFKVVTSPCTFQHLVLKRS